MQLNTKAKDVNVAILKPKAGRYTEESLESAFDKWKKNNPEADIISMDIKNLGGISAIFLTYKQEPGKRYSEVEDPAWVGISLVEKIKKVIIDDMRRRADIIGFKEFDGEGCFEQLCNDIQAGHGVELIRMLEDSVEPFVDSWEMDTKTNMCNKFKVYETSINTDMVRSAMKNCGVDITPGTLQMAYSLIRKHGQRLKLKSLEDVESMINKYFLNKE